MAYKVIRHFTDIQDNNYAYDEGDIYPRDGMSVLPSRIRELATAENRQGVALIVEVDEEKPKRKTAKADKD
jgi:hypothetical protein